MECTTDHRGHTPLQESCRAQVNGSRRYTSAVIVNAAGPMNMLNHLPTEVSDVNTPDETRTRIGILSSVYSEGMCISIMLRGLFGSLFNSCSMLLPIVGRIR